MTQPKRVEVQCPNCLTTQAIERDKSVKCVKVGCSFVLHVGRPTPVDPRPSLASLVGELIGLSLANAWTLGAPYALHIESLADQIRPLLTERKP